MFRISDSSCLVKRTIRQTWLKTNQVASPWYENPVACTSFLSRNTGSFGCRLVTQVCLKTQSSILITWQLFYRICKMPITVSVMLSCSVSQHSKYVYKDTISGWGAGIWLYHMNKGEGNKRHMLPFRSGRLRDFSQSLLNFRFQLNLITISCSTL